jgi:alpha-D-ribose 1-methylphosphonate 5-triphosphate synthase subunit PhnG
MWMVLGAREAERGSLRLSRCIDDAGYVGYLLGQDIKSYEFTATIDSLFLGNLTRSHLGSGYLCNLDGCHAQDGF